MYRTRSSSMSSASESECCGVCACAGCLSSLCVLVPLALPLGPAERAGGRAGMALWRLIAAE